MKLSNLITSNGFRQRLLFGVLILAVTAGALGLRLPRLNQRPMHTDEAVHAYKFGELLEKGEYQYDPYEFHGPTLNYLTLVGARLSSEQKLSEINETTLRIVPVIFGVGLVVLFLMLGSGLGRMAAGCGAILTALSPAMVFYSRYYIQETLLVFFTFLVIGAGWRYSRKKHWGWALLAGVGMGLMHATKETCIIAWGALLGSLVIILIWKRRQEKATSGFHFPIKGVHLAAAVTVAAIISVVLFSSFFTNASGPLDSLRTYATYFDRADGRGIHDHAWYYYLKMLIYSKEAPGPSWSEGLIVGLALVGLIAGILRKGVGGVGGTGTANVWLIRFIGVYTVLMTIIYSVIPYKTPWCMLGFLHGMIILAGVGAVALVRLVPTYVGKVVICGLLLAAVYQLGGQAGRASFRFYADQRNPYVYAHTVRDLVRLARRVEDIARVHPAGHEMYIQIVTHPDDYWPLPWYLRRFNPDHVGYHTEIPEIIKAPVVITSVKMQAGVEGKLEGSYQSEIYGLRPGVLLVSYVKKAWWDAFIEERQKEGKEQKQ